MPRLMKEVAEVVNVHPYAVRKQSSGRTASVTWVVVKNPGGRRVSTWPLATRADAQARADELNISAMVVPAEEDPRPYEIRRAEAEATYRGVSPVHRKGAGGYPACGGQGIATSPDDYRTPITCPSCT